MIHMLCLVLSTTGTALGENDDTVEGFVWAPH